MNNSSSFLHFPGSNASSFAYAAAQIKKAMDVTQLLGGQNFVLWGGREGYQTLLNTDMGLELDNYARCASQCKQRITS